jgi:PIN domain nuclease of toxin-antitoxin system
VIVLDTHAWVWWCANRTKIPAKTLAILDQESELFVSAISAWEVCMLVAKGRLTFTQEPRVAVRLLAAAPNIRMIPITDAVATEAGLLGSKLHGDPADRLVVATTLDLRARLVTKDRKITISKLVPVVW